MNTLLIEKYFFGKLTEEEATLFLNLKNNNVQFREKLEYLESLKLVCKIEDDLQFKNMIASFEKDLKQQTKTIPLRRSVFYKIAIAAVFLISLGIITTLFVFNKTEPKDLFATYFEVSKNVSYPTVRSFHTQNSITDAFVAYENKEYAKAFSLFDTYFMATKDTTVFYYQANVLIATQKPTEAINLLTHLENSSSTLASRSHWYKAMAYLQSNQVQEAKRELEILIENQEEFKNGEAKKLLEKLN